MRILYVAELVGKAGVYALKKILPSLKKDKSINFTLVCADGATGGNGLGRHHAGYIHKLGADVITTGDRCFYKKDLVENWAPYVLRPLNLGDTAVHAASGTQPNLSDKERIPGFGWRAFKITNPVSGAEEKIAAAVLLGSNFARLKADNPFTKLSSLLKKLRSQTHITIIDFHAWATGEKRTLFAAAAGACTAVIGSHNRVQTADEEILDGTAVICDAGRTGSTESIGGSGIAAKIQEYRTGIPDWTKDAWDKCELQGVIIEADGQGRALSIERIRIPVL